MSCWASNATWLHLKDARTAQKGSKSVRHVALCPRHVVLGLQRDVAPAQRCQNSPKESQKRASRRIGSAPCRVGPPTRRDSSSKAPKQPKREPKACVTSYWECAMSCWASNATWLHLTSKASKQPKREQEERATSHWAPAMTRWASNATWLPNFRLHRTVTGTDKRWRNHFGSRRGGLCVAVGSI